MKFVLIFEENAKKSLRNFRRMMWQFRQWNLDYLEIIKS